MSEEIADLKMVEKEEMSVSVSKNNNWMGGIVLIGVGVIFLLRSLGIFYLHNWWALFILLPAVANFSEAWKSYKQNGHLTTAGRGPFIGGLFMTLIASTFLFSWSWGVIWPVFLIIGGVGALMSRND